MKYTDMACIKCGRTFTTDSPPDWSEDGPPNDGLLFISYGNYGSTVYDPQGDGLEHLVIIVCDPCILAQARKQNVLHIRLPRPNPPPAPKYRGPWLPGIEEVK